MARFKAKLSIISPFPIKPISVPTYIVYKLILFMYIAGELLFEIKPQ
jgi:hypothetical protein